MFPHYNLDAIISIGYRGNSKQAEIFRQLATHILRNYLAERPNKVFTL